MLRQRFVLFLFAMLASGTATANTINLISQTYRIEGYGTTYPIGGIPDTVLYDETSNAPLTRDDSRVSICNIGDVLVSCGAFRVYNLAAGGVNSTAAFIQAASHTDDASLAIAVYARATASITFMALEPELFLKTEIWGRGSTRIYDETSQSLIFFDDSQIFAPGGPPFFTYVVPFNLGHVYTMTASTETCCLARGEAKLTITSVGESETSYAFLLIGLAVLLVPAFTNPALFRQAS